MEISAAALTANKAKELSTALLNEAHELRDQLKADEVTVDEDLKKRITGLADFLEVATNLDSLKDTQTAMYNLRTEIKDLCDEAFGNKSLEQFEKFLDSLWTAGPKNIKAADLAVLISADFCQMLAKVETQGHS